MSTPDALWASKALRHLGPASITCSGLRRRIGRGQLLDGVDLTVPVGARLLVTARPPDAASLLLRILAGVARPDAGTVSLAGLAAGDDSSRGWARRVGYVPARPVLPAWMSGREAIELSARLLGFDRLERRDRVGRALARTGLTAGRELDRTLRRVSGPMRELVTLASALVAEPEILLLDDPLRGLDPWDRWRILGGLEPRTTLVIASGSPASVEGLVKQVALLAAGRVAIHAPVTELTRRGLPLTLGGIAQLASGTGEPTRSASESAPRPASAIEAGARAR